MDELLRRRAMMAAASGDSPTPPEPVLPEGYQRIEYVERLSSASTAVYNTIGGFIPNNSDPLEIRIGFMITAAPTTSYGYVICGGQRTGDNTVGFGVCVTKAMDQVGCYGGANCFVTVSALNKKIDSVAKKNSSGTSFTDGTRTNQVSHTPRSVGRAFNIFGLKYYNSNYIINPFVGRIYYCTIIEGGETMVNMLPCRKGSTVGFYDTVTNVFRYDTSYVAGPDVN